MTSFNDFDLNNEILTALKESGYETPTPIQTETIPVFLAGGDLLAQAQTGTGKTAAFALPILMRINFAQAKPQALILTPTRELGLQVAEAFQNYAKYLPDFHVLPIYGGQNIQTQLRALKRGVHVIVGTPGRVMDLLERKAITTEHLRTLVLDEADEMLNMGFLDDVEWIMEQITVPHQTALFSATMPKAIKKIAERYLQQPKIIEVRAKKTLKLAIRQFHTFVTKHHKFDALTRFLEIEDFDGVIIFTRTKTASSELSEKLNARGYASAALNGDMNQALREKVVAQMKNKSIDIIVATDVAARGIDIPRVTHVMNYDAPYDVESYIHRIGRTGRAGRSGTAILFIAPKEQRILKEIARVTQHKTEELKTPSVKQIHLKRQEKLAQEITEILADMQVDLDHYRELISALSHDSEKDLLDIAAALAFLNQKDKLTPVQEDIEVRPEEPKSKSRKFRDFQPAEAGMRRYRVELGHQHDIKPGQIVGLIANKADISSKLIGAIAIHADHTFIDIAESVPEQRLRKIGKIKFKTGVFQLKPV